MVGLYYVGGPYFTGRTKKGDGIQMVKQAKTYAACRVDHVESSIVWLLVSGEDPCFVEIALVLSH